jgi:hypothetical protein
MISAMISTELWQAHFVIGKTVSCRKFGALHYSVPPIALDPSAIGFWASKNCLCSVPDKTRDVAAQNKVHQHTPGALQAACAQCHEGPVEASFNLTVLPGLRPIDFVVVVSKQILFWRETSRLGEAKVR